MTNKQLNDGHIRTALEHCSYIDGLMDAAGVINEQMRKYSYDSRIYDAYEALFTLLMKKIYEEQEI